MVSRRNNRFRRYKRNRSRKLSTRNIFSNRSAKSQANQIYALNRRVSRISKAMRPEIKTYISTSNSRNYTSDLLGNIYGEYVFPNIPQGSGESQRVGDIIRVKNWNIYISMEYFNNSDTGYHNSESSGAQWRLICLQPRNTVVRGSLEITDLIHNASNSGSDYTLMGLAPLVEGITSDYYILYDRHGTITSDSNQRMIKVSLNNVRPIRWTSQEGESNLPLFVIVITGLHYDSNFTETVQVSSLQKIAYTDA